MINKVTYVTYLCYLTLTVEAGSVTGQSEIVVLFPTIALISIASDIFFT